jgi:hypothetical protein
VYYLKRVIKNERSDSSKKGVDSQPERKYGLKMKSSTCYEYCSNIVRPNSTISLHMSLLGGEQGPEKSAEILEAAAAELHL